MNQAKKTIPMPVRYTINFILMASFIIIGTFVVNNGLISSYYTKILMLVGINIILAVSLNMVTGYLGQLPLGHAGFMAVGAYTGGIFMKAINLTAIGRAMSASGGDPVLAVKYYGGIVAAVILSGIVAGIFGLIIGIPALRLKGDYLAIITLGFREIIRVVLLNIDSVLGFNFTFGASGLKQIPKITTFFNVFLCVMLTCVIIHMVMKSRHGRAILSIRENEIAAESCGIKTTYYKTMAFVMSAFFAGVAGCMYAGYLGILQPTTFGFMKSIEILVMVVLGGMGSMIGSIASAAVLTALPQVLLMFDSYRMVIYSLVLVIVMIFKPTGLMGTYDFSLSRILERLINYGKSKKEAAK